MTDTDVERTPWSRFAAGLAADDRLDRIVEPLATVAERLLADPARRRLLQGAWLGHPVHPVLTDLPVGFWTSAFVFDLAGRRCTRAGDGMIAAGIAAAVPTAITGLADWHDRSPEDRRIGSVHAVANLTATVLYAAALGHRLKGNGLRGFVFSMAGATAATLGGYLGGHLAFGSSQPEEAEVADDARSDVVDPQGAALAAVTAAAG